MTAGVDGAHSFGWNSPPPTTGDESKYVGANPNPEDCYDLDPAIGPDNSDRQTGSDSYVGIPGDGEVPG